MNEQPHIRPANATGLPDSRFSPLVLWAGIRKNLILVAATALTIALGTTFYTLGQTKIYEANATVLFDPQPPRPLGKEVQAIVDTGSGAYWNNKEYYRTQYWVIQSMRVASAVVKQLGLNKDPAFLDDARADSNASPREVSVEAAAQKLREDLTVEPVKESRLALVRYRDADPGRAQKILTALVETYVQLNLDDTTESTNLAADWLQHQEGALKKDLESSEMALHGYKKEKNILSVSMDDQSNMLREEMKQLNAALTEVKTQRERVSSRLEELKKVDTSNPVNLPANELLSSATLQRLRDAYVTATSERDGLMGAGKGPNHPDVLAAEARHQVAKEALRTEIENIRGSIERDQAALTHEMGGLQKLFDASERRALELNLLEIEYNRLRRSKDQNERLFSLVTERSKESDLTRMLRINNIRVVDRPLLPKSPVTPNVPLNIAVGAVVGLILGFALAIGREQLDRSIKTPDDVERELGLTFLGLLPEIDGTKTGPSYGNGHRRRGEPKPNLERPELVVHEQPMSGIAEAARAIRTNIFFMSPDRPFLTLLVTSAGPAEGKTTVACCLATAMAQAGKRVVLVDCDMRRPRLHRVFGISNDAGVTSALLDPSLLDSLAQETQVPNLSVITTGPLPPNPAELLHSEAFEKVIDRLRTEYDRVIIDSPPIVPVTDAAVLSGKLDGTVLVVRAFNTSKELARRAMRALRDVGGRTVGIVLNAVDLERREYGYYQYYYYKREGYASAPASGAERAEREPPEAPSPPAE